MFVPSREYAIIPIQGHRRIKRSQAEAVEGVCRCGITTSANIRMKKDSMSRPAKNSTASSCSNGIIKESKKSDNQVIPLCEWYVSNDSIKFGLEVLIMNHPDGYDLVGTARHVRRGFRVWSQIDRSVEFVHSLCCCEMAVSPVQFSCSA